MDSQRKEQIQITKISGDVVTSIGGLATYYDSDWFVNILLTKTIEFTDYVQISLDNYKFTIERQNINPYFLELGFLETIETIDYNKNNIKFWSDFVKQNENIESPSMYNLLSNVTNQSLELKSSVFDIQIQPDPVVSDDVTTITNKMKEIKSSTEANQISFVESKVNQ